MIASRKMVRKILIIFVMIAMTLANFSVYASDTVSVTSVSLNKTEDTIAAGETDTLTATISPSNAENQNVTWTSSNTSVATVDNNGVVTGVNAGSAVIIVSTVDGNKKATCTVTVTGSTTVHPTSVSLSKTEDNIIAGETDTLIATVFPDNSTNQNVTWTSSNASVATVDNNGVVTGVNEGTAIIIAATVDGNKKATCTVTVTGSTTVHPTSVSLNKTEDTIAAGETDTLTATISPSNAENQNVTWTSSNTSVATVDNNGVVTGVNAGSAVIIVSTVDGNKKATCTVTVTGSTTVHPTSVSLSKTEDNIIAGETDTLIATVFPDNSTNQNVIWTSSNPSVATVDDNGVVTGVNAGSAVIIVATVDGNKKATCIVTVTGNAPVQQGIKGIVKDAVTNVGISGVSISVLDSSGATIATASSSSSGEFNINLPVGSRYSVTLSKEGYIPLTYENIEITANQTNYLETILQIDNQHSGLGNIAGTITNALNGQVVSGITLNLRKGINVKSGDIVSTSSTNDQGNYSIGNLEAGNYTVEISKTGFTTSYFTVISIGGTTKSNQNATITPVVPYGQTRIVLSWGASPSDLDSHITGPAVDGSRFHVYYSNKYYYNGATTYTNLDVDDTTSYGPETITINVQSEGIYRYSVFDYSNGSSTSSSALSNSGATVKVYRGSESIATFYVPANKIGKTWTVFELDGTTLTPINTITNDYPQ